MVEVTLPPEAEDDRAQMLLVGAFGLAVMMVALALILNTAIYTENIATRGGDIIGGKDAMQYRATVERAAGGAISYANYHNNTTLGNVETTATDSMAAWSNLSATEQGLSGQVTNVTVIDTTMGTRIYQNRVRNFTNRTEYGTSEVNWTLVEHTPALRNFSMTVQNATVGNIGVFSLSEVYRFIVTGDAGTVRQVLIYTEPDGSFVVEVQDGGGSTLDSCTRDVGSEANISVTGATVEGDRCGALAFFDALDTPYKLTFNNTKDGNDDTIEGTYSLVVAETPGDLTTTEDFGPLSGYDVPDIEPAMYSMTVTVVYRTPRLLYRTKVRAAPGEPDE